MDIKICIFVAGILFTTFQGVFGRNYTVSSWKICSNRNFDRVSDHGSKFHVGDRLVFSLEDENDGIARVMSESEYEACRVEGSKAVIFEGGEGIELNTSGIWYFISRISDRCKLGKKVKISVVGGSVVIRNRSLRNGGSGHGGGGGGSAGSGGGGSSGSGGSTGTPGGLTTPRGGNRSRPKDNNAAAAAALKTCPSLIVLIGISLILFNVY